MKNIVYISFTLFILFSCGSENSTKENHPSTPENKENSNPSHTHAHYSYKKGVANFIAYKLPAEEKAGVVGHFDEVIVTNTKTGDSPEEAIEGLEFAIPVESLSTDNNDRDQKIKNHFFGNMVDTDTIKGVFKKIGNNTITASIKMNNVEKDFDFDYTFEDNKLIAKSEIDVVQDFSALLALEGINKACYDLHKGKTWPDVKLDFVIFFDKQ